MSAKRLDQAQKLLLLQWIGEGLTSGEINKRAALSAPPFRIDRSTLAYYRRTRGYDQAEIVAEKEKSALSSGLALRENRVSALQEVAEMILDDLRSDGLWVEDSKGIGSGAGWKEVVYDRFRSEEIEQLRGVMEDIAVEMGERKQAEPGANKEVYILWNMPLPPDHTSQAELKELPEPTEESQKES